MFARVSFLNLDRDVCAPVELRALIRLKSQYHSLYGSGIAQTIPNICVYDTESNSLP